MAKVHQILDQDEIEHFVDLYKDNRNVVDKYILKKLDDNLLYDVKYEVELKVNVNGINYLKTVNSDRTKINTFVSDILSTFRDLALEEEA